MFEETASLGKALMDGLWALFGIYVPGFSFTFGQLWLGVLLASIWRVYVCVCVDMVHNYNLFQ